MSRSTSSFKPKNATVVFTAPRTVVVEKGPVPDPSDHEVLVRVTQSGISAGTERLVYRGEGPAEAEADATIDALSGSLSFPLRYGYCSVGRVEALGAGVDDKWKGRRVFAFHPHARWICASPDDLIPLPVGLTDDEAVFLPNMETAVNLVMDAQPSIGARIAVFGLGVVGSLTTALLSQFPLEVLVSVDPRAARRDQARALGAPAVAGPQTLIRQHRDGEYPPFDVCIECSGNPDALNQAMSVCGFGGRIVVGSWFGTKPVTLDLGRRFHRRRLQLVSSQVSTIAPRYQGRWTKTRRLKLAMDALQKHSPTSMITHRFPVEQAAAAYAALDTIHPSSADTEIVPVQLVLTY